MIRSALMVALTATTVAAQGFEGVVTMTRTSGNGQPQEMTYLAKDGKIRVDTPTGSVIMDGGANKMVLLMAPQKIYVETDLNGAITESAGKQPPKMTHTGKTETIAGYNCEHITFTSDDGVTDVCAAQGLGRFLVPSMGRGGAPAQGSWVKALGDLGFPLKVEHDGKVEQVVTKVEKKSLDASLFSAPADFTKMNMPGRGGGL